MSGHLCLSCRYAAWQRKENGRLTGAGLCEAPDPKLPELPAAKWWHGSGIIAVRGGNIYRERFAIGDCPFYKKPRP